MSPYDEGESGGGSTTTVCTPSPSDNAAILGNLISRISDIEKFLSQLVGADVYANNLSELAVNLGNVLNGTITLPNSDNSPYGVGGSIPVPDGFNGTVISGNVTTIWTNGVVSFQVDNTGVVVGGGGGSILHTVLQNGPNTSVANDVAWHNLEMPDLVNIFSPTMNSNTLSVTKGTYTLTVPTSGMYLVSVNVNILANTNVYQGLLEMDVYSFNDDGDIYWESKWDVGIDATTYINNPLNATVTGGLYVSAGSSIYVKARTNLVTGSSTWSINNISIVKLN